jgi:F0F1-type ATP synthase assembly protein I
MLLVACGVFVKWVVDDFRGSRVSPITWLLVVSSVLGFVLGANSALQLSIELRQHRDLHLLSNQEAVDHPPEATM